MKFMQLVRPTNLQLLTFTELESTTCFGTTRFLTFNSTRVTSHEAFGTQSSLIFRIDFYQCTGDSQTQSLRLTSETTTAKVNFNVILFSYAKLVQRLLNHVLENA